MFGRRAALTGFVAALSGCGFRPVYAPRDGQPNGAQAQLGTVRVAAIPERTGQLLRQELQARLDHGDALAKRYELVASFGLTVDAIGIQSDTSSSRLRYVGTSSWSLRTMGSPQAIVTSGNARSLDGLNVLDQQYFEADLASETVTRRLAANLADQITLELASYFARTPTAG